MPMQGEETRFVPRSIGKYRIDDILGRGAMGVVYKAYDAAIDRIVALKTIRADLLAGKDGAQWLDRFRREARAAARCLHPNIIAVFDYGEEGGTAYIAMEYVVGRQLQDFFTDRKPIDRTVALSVITQVLNALDYAHARNIVHRDIKPSNVMLIAGGEVKVADFGIARIDAIEVTQMGAIVGTPGYMSPEQFTGGPVDKRSDLFSTGIVLFELLTGEKPFPGRSTTDIMYRVLNHPPRDAREVNPEVPPALNAVVRQALARDPEDRFQTAASFNAALAAAAASTGQGIEPTGIELPPTVIAAPAVRVPAPTLGTRVAGLQAELVRRVEEDLAYYVGPVAKVLVRKAAPNSATLEALYQALAVNIAGEADRAAFLRKAHQMPTMSRTAGSRPGGSKPGGTGSGQTGPTSIAGTGGQPGTGGATGIGSLGFGETGGSTGMADPELEKIRRDLTVILGPIASVLIRRLAPKAGSIGQLYRLLAEHIPNPDDRDKFLKKAPLL